jgi:hypothetical protein
MRKIKEDVLKRLTNFDLDIKTFHFGGEILQDFYAFYPSPGAHEREEAIELILNNSFAHDYNDGAKKDELETIIRSIVTYLEFNGYFYGVSVLPSTLFFYEDENSKRLASMAINMGEKKLSEYKNHLQKIDLDPGFVVLYAVVEIEGEWKIRMSVKSGVKCIFDNLEYIEYGGI